MSVNIAVKFLEELSENAEVREFYGAYRQPEGADKEDGILAVAEHFDYHFTKEDLKAAMDTMAERSKAARQAAEAAVTSLSADDLDAVAGGNKTVNGKEVNVCDQTGACFYGELLGSPECADTYVDEENCWSNDGCDVVYNKYSGYSCHINYFWY